jgi:yecA family protein
MIDPEPFQPRHQKLLEAFFERHHADREWGFGECAGFLFAVHSAPEMVPPSDWLPMVLDDIEFAGEAEAKPVLGGLMSLYNWIGERTERGELPIPPGYRPRSPAMDNYEKGNPFGRWRYGFFIGHGWLRELWAEHVSDHDELIGQVMMPVLFLADIDRARELYEQILDQKRSFEEAAESMLAILPQALIEYAEAGRGAFQAVMQQRTQPVRSDKIGRNDPCPCGSGKKYKKCCLPGEQQGRERRPDPAHAEPDFQGLSPHQMHQLIYYPLESPELLHFRDCLTTEPEAPILGLFQHLVEGLGEKGLKATAKGNLPREFCRQAAQDAARLGRAVQWLEPQRLRSETDYMDLHVTRLVAGLAGLVRKYKGRFVLTKKARSMLEKAGLREIYPLLLKTYTIQFNWAYRDRAEELPIIQHAFAYTLYLLDRHGRQWQPHNLYEEAFVKAFPAVLAEVPDRDVYPAERAVRDSYRWRTLQHFLEFFGLIEMEALSDDYLDRKYRIRVRPLFGEAVRFSVDAAAHNQGRVH